MRAVAIKFQQVAHRSATCLIHRAYSTYRDAGSGIRRIPITVGSSGTFDLTISNATQDVSSLIVTLPSSSEARPFARDESSSSSLTSLAQAFPRTIIVEIKYRLDAKHAFPIPIHDTFTAWDHIRNNFDGLPIYVVGSHIGGSLALALALTSPNSIASVAVLNPVVDWTCLDEIAAKSIAPRASKTKRSVGEDSGASEETRAVTREQNRLTRRVLEAQAARHLISLRRRLFHSPGSYFDEFASPLLLLRAAGRDTPANNLAAEREFSVNGVKMRYGEEDEEVGYIRDDGHKSDQAYGPYDDEWYARETRQTREEYYSKYETLTKVLADGPKRRKVLKRWPSNDRPENATLPNVNIFNSSTEFSASDTVDVAPVLRLQGKEMVDVMRRACFWGKEKGLAEETVVWTDLKDVQPSSKFDHIVSWLKEQHDLRTTIGNI